MAKNKTRQILFVLGMHRSGTSLLTGLLAKLGVGLPKSLMADHVMNANGFFESTVVMNINNDILAEGGSRWKDWRPFHLADEKMEYAIERIGQVLDEEYTGSSLIALKDPRICRMAPLWLTAANRNGYSPRILLPYRHPMEVADSLRARDGLATPEALLMWLRHVLDAEQVSRGLPRVFMPMADLLADWRRAVGRIGSELDIEWPVNPESAASEIDRFVSKDLKHQNLAIDILETDTLLMGWVADTFKSLEALTLVDNARNRTRLDAVRQLLDNAGRLFGPAMEDKNGRIGKLERLNRTSNQSLEAVKTSAAFETGKLTAERDLALADISQKQMHAAEFESFRTQATTKQAELTTERDRALADLSEHMAVAQMHAAQFESFRTQTISKQVRLMAERDQAFGMCRQVAAAQQKAEVEHALQQAESHAAREVLRDELRQATLEYTQRRVSLEMQLSVMSSECDEQNRQLKQLRTEAAAEAEQRRALETQLSAMTVDRDEHTRLLNRFRGAARVHFLAWAFNKGLRPT